MLYWLLAQSDPVTGSAAWGGVTLLAIKLLADARKRSNGFSDICIKHGEAIAILTESLRHTDRALADINKKLDQLLNLKD